MTPLVTSNAPTGLAPATIGAVYDLHTGLVAPTGSAGTGQVIALIDAYHDPNALSDLNAFDADYGYPTMSTCSSGPPFTTSSGPCFYQADPQGTPATNSSWILEESLDIEWAHAEAPGATIVLVEANTSSNANLYNAVTWANDNGATEESMSWSSAEANNETSYDSYFDATSTSTGAPILYTAAAGDSWPRCRVPSRLSQRDRRRAAPRSTDAAGRVAPGSQERQPGRIRGWHLGIREDTGVPVRLQRSRLRRILGWHLGSDRRHACRP